MRKILLTASGIAGIAGMAHAATLPSQGLNGGSFSGSTAAIGSSPATALSNPGQLQNGEAHVSTSGAAFSSSTITQYGANSVSASTGMIQAGQDGTVNYGTTGVQVMRTDQAFTGAGLTISGPTTLLGIPVTGKQTISTSALSGQTLSLDNVNSPGSYETVTSTGGSASSAQLGITTTASAGSNGSLSGTVGQYGGFSGERVDQAQSSESLSFSNGTNTNGFAGNAGAEANAGHDLGLAVNTQAEGGAPTVTNSISDTNMASSLTSPSLSNGGLTLTSASTSSDTLGGGIADTPANGGNYFGTSNVNAQTDEQLTGNLSLGSTQISAGGLSGKNNTIN